MKHWVPPTVSLKFDNEFADLTSTHAQNIFPNCTSDSTGNLSGPLTYKEVASVCSNLKPGVSGVLLYYEHIRYAGPFTVEVVIPHVPTVF